MATIEKLSRIIHFEIVSVLNGNSQKQSTGAQAMCPFIRSVTEALSLIKQHPLIVRITLHVSPNIIGIYCLLLNKTNKRYNRQKETSAGRWFSSFQRNADIYTI